MDIELDAVPHYGFCIDELYHGTRTHLALQKHCPEPRDMQSPDAGPIVSIAEVGAVHHRYERRPA
ncbi:MAG: hypothetical protein JO249_17610 [Acidobacteria bacterium]|nr:hypothetical protein [Acidobacteriota bacterium]